MKENTSKHSLLVCYQGDQIGQFFAKLGYF
jgi:hypothetical protein